MRARFSSLVLATGLALGLLMVSAPASAQVTVKVFTPAQEGVSATDLRQKAMLAGFAQAVSQLAVRLLPCDIGEVRTGLLATVMETRADHYVLSYREVQAAHSAEGFRLEMEVEVDRRLLRDDLRALGLAASCQGRLAFALEPGDGLIPEDMDGLRDLARLAGMNVTPGVTPRLKAYRVGEDLITGELATPEGVWAASGPNAAAVWIELWGKYFARLEALANTGGGQMLMVSGWFTPDGVFEFDRVLDGWDLAVSEVRLVDVDMVPTGVEARWSIQVTDKARLASLLDGWLAGRGLTYSLIGPDGL